MVETHHPARNNCLLIPSVTFFFPRTSYSSSISHVSPHSTEIPQNLTLKILSRNISRVFTTTTTTTSHSIYKLSQQRTKQRRRENRISLYSGTPVMQYRTTQQPGICILSNIPSRTSLRVLHVRVANLIVTSIPHGAESFLRI